MHRATALTISSTIPVAVAISSNSAIYTDDAMTSPATIWPATVDVPTTWWVAVDSTASLHIKITASNDVVLMDELIYIDAGTPYTIDASRALSPQRVAEITLPPATWAQE